MVVNTSYFWTSFNLKEQYLLTYIVLAGRGAIALCSTSLKIKGGGDGTVVKTDTCVSTGSQGCEEGYKVWAKAEKFICLYHVFV